MYSVVVVIGGSVVPVLSGSRGSVVVVDVVVVVVGVVVVGAGVVGEVVVAVV